MFIEGAYRIRENKCDVPLLSIHFAKGADPPGTDS